MKPYRFLHEVIDPALVKLNDWTGAISDDRARVLLMAIAGQESNWSDRRQIDGPARSYFQFERGGGVIEVMQKCPSQLSVVCAAFDIPFNAETIFEAMAWNDILAVTMARLLLWQDPKPLPEVTDPQSGWMYYLRNWRPGAPHPDKWTDCHAAAVAVTKEKTT